MGLFWSICMKSGRELKILHNYSCGDHLARWKMVQYSRKMLRIIGEAEIEKTQMLDFMVPKRCGEPPVKNACVETDLLAFVARFIATHIFLRSKFLSFITRDRFYTIFFFNFTQLYKYTFSSGNPHISSHTPVPLC